jgi:hypothetical protein
MDMKHIVIVTAAAVVFAVTSARAEVKVTVDHNSEGTPKFKFEHVPSPSKTDAAAKAKFTIVDGERDDNGGPIEKLNDGGLPTEQDEPAENFFFNAGTDGGRLALDLGSVVEVKQVNTYSWHPNTRGPQVYKLYASDGKPEGFNAKPAKDTALDKAGWKLVAKVDTRKDGENGGQYGVSISDSDGLLGKYRYLLFDVSQTESDDTFGNTFYSEIDVIAAAPGTASAESGGDAPPFVVKSTDGYCTITIDTSKAPDLKEWAEKKLAPVLAEWYPKLTTTLASDGYNPPTNFSVIIAPGDGVAATGGNRVTANSDWLKRELNREAVGSLVHEEVHVVQRYGGGRRSNPDFKRPPGWLVEGIPDYIRWFLYEPQSHGADAVFFKGRRNQKLNYDGRYRISANFLNYVVLQYDKDKTLITTLNAACRQGKYSDDFWKDKTGKTISELNDEWKAALQKQIEVSSN